MNGTCKARVAPGPAVRLGHMEGGSDTRFSGGCMTKGSSLQAMDWLTILISPRFSKGWRGLIHLFLFNSILALGGKMHMLILGKLWCHRKGGKE